MFIAKRSRRAVLRLAVLGVAASAVYAPADARGIALERKTRAGVVFQHIVVQDTQHVVTIGFPDGYSRGLPDAKSATYSFVGSMLAYGTAEKKQGELYEDMADLRSRFSLSASQRQASIQLSGPPASLPKAAEIAGKVLAAPALPADKLVRLIKTSAIGWRAGQERADTLAGQMFSRLLLADARDRRQAALGPAAYADVTSADIRAWMANVLVRERAVVVSAGPMSVEAAGDVVDTLLAALPSTAPAGERRSTALRNPGRLVVLEKPGIAQTSIAAGGPTAWVSGGELMPGTLGARVLGGDFSSRLNTVVRGRLGAAYGISARLSTYDPRSIALQITSSVDNAQARAVIDAVRETYASFLASGVTAAEFEAQRSKLRQELRDRDAKAQPTATAAFAVLMAGLPIEMLATQSARLDALALPEVNRLIGERMAKPPLTIAVVAPSADGLGADCVVKALEELDRCL